MSSSPVSSDQLINQRIDEARRALWWGELIRRLLAIVIGSMVATLAWLLFDHWVYASGPPLRTMALVALVAGASWFIAKRVWPVLTSRVSEEYAAWALEQGHSDYRQQLTSYVALKPDGPAKGLRARVVGLLGMRAAGLLKTHDELPAEATGTFRWWISAACVFALLMAYIVGSPKSSLASAHRLIAPLSAIDPAQRVTISEVEPRDAEALAGRNVAVSSRVTGLRQDESVFCRWTLDGAAFESELSLDPSTGLHQGELTLPHSASGRVPYRLEAGDAVAGPFELDVENVPVVAIQRVNYEPPAYTGRKAKTVSSPAITAIDGTTVRILAKTNRPAQRAEIQFNPKELGQTVRATAGRLPMQIADDGTTLTAELKLRSSRGKAAAVEPESYRVRVWDSNQQANPDPIIYPIRIIPDLPPEVAIVVPQKSPIEVPITAQQIIEVHAMDADFELQEVSLRIDRGIDTLSEPLIWLRRAGESGRGNQVMEYRFRPAEHRVNVGDTVRIFAIALDNRESAEDPSVEPNRSVTDPVEIRITEGDTELPDDPSANDGLSRPDQRPASDVNQSEKGQGEQQTGGGSGQPSDSSEAEGSGQQGEGAQQSGSSESGKEQDADQQGAASDGGESQQGMPQDGMPQDKADSPQDGEPSGDANENPPGAGEQAGDPAGNPQQPGQQPGNETGRQDGQPTEGQPGEPTGNQQQTRGTQGESNSGEGSDSDSEAPPKHDGEAFERIKDFVEQKREQDSRQQSSNGDDSESQQGADESRGDNAGAPREPGEDQQLREGSPTEREGGNKNSSTGDETPEGDDRGHSSERMKDDPQGNSSGKSESQSSHEPQQGENSPDDVSREGSDAQGEPSSSGENRNSEPNEKPTDQQGDSSSESPQQPQQGEAGASGDEQGGKQEGNPDGEQRPEQGQDSEADGGESKRGSAGEQRGSQSDSAGDNAKPKDEGAEGSPADSKPSSDASSPSSKSSPQNSNSPGQSSDATPPPSDSSSNGDGTGTGTMPSPGEDAASEPPPPDLEYAKEATDMVLDYLDETRDQVDPELLKDLNWTKQDLERFRQRWQKVRDLKQAPSDAKPNSELEDALKSLGLKPKTQGAGTREAADSFRSLRDSGNRRKAPAAYRDAFDAFRARSKE